MTDKPKKSRTPGQDRLVEQIRRAGYAYMAIEDGVRAYKVPGVGRVDGATIERAVAAGRLRASGDALFGGPSQTYVAV